jgi:hypothetical protein
MALAEGPKFVQVDIENLKHTPHGDIPMRYSLRNALQILP